MKNTNIWIAIINPNAGAGKTGKEWEKAQTMLHSKGIEYECRTTSSKGHAVEIAREAVLEGYRNFLAVGGDGTVHEVLGGMMDGCQSLGMEAGQMSDYRLAVIPIGSGNDWIKSHNIPHDTEKVINLLSSNSFVRQDVVKVTSTDATSGKPVETYMANIGGVGFDARICLRVNALKDKGKGGKMIYVSSLLSTLFSYDKMSVRIECDGVETFNGPCYSIAFGTGKYSGGGMRQVPEAIFDDGLLDMTVIPPFSIPRILKEAPKLFTGKLLKVKELTVARAKSIKVSPLSEPEYVEVDGENVGNLPMTLDVLDSQIWVLDGNCAQ